jgi:hypothetical protein
LETFGLNTEIKLKLKQGLKCHQKASHILNEDAILEQITVPACRYSSKDGISVAKLSLYSNKLGLSFLKNCYKIRNFHIRFDIPKT